MLRDKILTALLTLYRRLQLALVTFVVTLAVSANSLFGRQRMSHENGIACAGHLRIVPDPRLPPHEFFQPGRTFGCRVRHGMASFKDDAKLVVRSASIKFADSRDKAPLDLLLNTGSLPLFWDARTFVGFMRVTMAGRGKYFTSHLRRYPQSWVGGGDSVRRDPDAFDRMVYHTQTVSGFVGEDGVYRYARYRLVPDPWDGTESGAPDTWDRDHPWLQNPYQDETRNRNYLKEATRAFLGRGGKLHYRLQIQLRDRPEDGANTQWLSSAVLWDQGRFPYLDLAEVELDRALSYEESMLTWFDLSRHPDSLPIPKASSIDDPHSLNHLRLAAIWATRARLLSYRLWGMPRAFSDSRQADDWQGIPPLRDPP